MFTPPNVLSFLRGPLALLFLIDNLILRVVSLALAVITDCIDGFLARRCGATSRLGAFLDPIMDKFFVYFVLLIMISEGKLAIWQSSLMISRDFFLCLFGIYLSITGGWQSCQFRSIITGKISTAMQFVTILMLLCGVHISPYFYYAFALIGCFVFFELVQVSKKMPNEP